MSRTRKTRPLHVRMVDPKDNGVGYTEVHNHVNGRECDLPDKHDPKTIAESYTGPFASPENRPCHYSFEYKGKGLCGCKMCTGQVERRAENRKKRHLAKQELHATIVNHSYEEDELE